MSEITAGTVHRLAELPELTERDVYVRIRLTAEQVAALEDDERSAAFFGLVGEAIQGALRTYFAENP